MLKFVKKQCQLELDYIKRFAHACTTFSEKAPPTPKHAVPKLVSATSNLFQFIFLIYDLIYLFSF